MVKKIIKKVKNILFVNPELIFAEEKEFVNKPFFFKGDNGKGILLVHGWTSTAYEVRRLGKFLNEAGFTVAGPMLRGHGTKPEDLENVKWQDWKEDLLMAVENLKKNCDEIYLGGTSVGANLAIMLALEKPEVRGLILMAMPYKIKFEKLLWLWANLIILFKKYNKKYYPPTFGASATITRIISYQKYSIKSALEVQKVFELSRKMLPEVKQPCFLIQSRHDHIVSYRSMDVIYAKLGSKIKMKKYISRAYHTFISDIRNEHVFQDILDFLNKN